MKTHNIVLYSIVPVLGAFTLALGARSATRADHKTFPADFPIDSCQSMLPANHQSIIPLAGESPFHTEVRCSRVLCLTSSTEVHA